MNDHCISCGAVIPEGRQICPACENYTKKELTRFEKVRDLDIDSLARLLIESACCHCININGDIICDCFDANCLECVKAWLMEKGDVF
jgi:predicted nucleic acid-binding Zn ribbon protein